MLGWSGKFKTGELLCVNVADVKQDHVNVNVVAGSLLFLIAVMLLSFGLINRKTINCRENCDCLGENRC